nr:hypothetical protein REQ54_04757 [Rhizobium sp. Q54]
MDKDDSSRKANKDTQRSQSPPAEGNPAADPNRNENAAPMEGSKSEAEPKTS